MSSYLLSRNDKVVTLVSGGLDAACMLAWAAQRELDQRAIYFNYGHDGFDREFACARINAGQFGVPLELVDLSGFRKSMLGRYGFPLNMGQNLLGGLLTSTCFSMLSASLGILDGRYKVLLGIHGTDLQQRPQIGRMGQLAEQMIDYCVREFGGEEFKLVFPFGELDRVDVIRMGHENGVRFEHTWSCQASFEAPCGACYSCEERAQAFATAGIADPQVS